MKKTLLIFVLALLSLNISEASELQQIEELGGDIVFEKPIKSVLFSHQKHIEDKKISCQSCHDKLFTMTKDLVSNQKNFNHQSFDSGKYCGSCHNGIKAFSTKENCTLCHIGAKKRK